MHVSVYILTYTLIRIRVNMHEHCIILIFAYVTLVCIRANMHGAFTSHIRCDIIFRTAHVRRTLLPAVRAVTVLTLRASVRLLTLGTGVLATLRALDGAAAVAVLFAHAEGA